MAVDTAIVLMEGDLMRTQRVIVVGAGIGGLVAALCLAAQGISVTVLEAGAGPGGKMRPERVDGAEIDCGPTVFTMRWVFDAILRQAGLSLDDHLTLKPLDVLARHAWETGGGLDLFADTQRNIDEIGRFAGLRDAQGYREFCARAARTFETLRDTFIAATRPDPVTLAARVTAAKNGSLFAIAPFATLWTELGRHFQDPRLRQLFGRYATYSGSSPFSAPATLMLIAHVEQQGVWRIEGGMRRLAAFFEDAARQRGVAFHYGARVRRLRLEAGRAAGVELDDGTPIKADAVVFNGDVAAIAAGLMGTECQRAVSAGGKSARSLSAMTWAIRAPTRGFPLAHHNVFFSADYAAEFDDLFRRSRLPRAPTVYVCAQDRGDDGSIPKQGEPERLLCLVNAPPNGDDPAYDEMDADTCEKITFPFLERCGLHILRDQGATVRRTPQTFERMFPATGGGLYGRATHGWMSSFQRPGARTRVPGLYLAGGSTHPGAGVPMAALSGQMAAASLATDLASTGRWHRVATIGGTSTRLTPNTSMD